MSDRLQCPDCAGEVVATNDVQFLWFGHLEWWFECQECDTAAWVPDRAPHTTARELWNRWCWERRQEGE